ncbi:MAG TPA: PTS sugar transporter subunit IIA [Anaerohalosphaeraceae bacterium]|nr:PTS sugar transporter subunit IIA [Anaerohalosphaeraceae bacterium]HOL88879.1 PTS sugar transporter subunit IIA [Anaerohalosphaeraceae bacterium]HPP55721.1 PTS sugar transporter subunit IIA [Anaerohalosphaeraceae bacterium]
MKLSDLIKPECIQTGMVIEDKAIALCEIAALAKKSPLCRHISEEDILEALQERETLGSTAFGGQVAIPHCRLKSIQDFVVGAVTIPDGVDFEAADRQKVRLIVFILAPAERPNAHIRLLSSISRALQNPKGVEKMVAAKDAKSLRQMLIRQAGAEIPLEVSSQKSLLHVFVQDEHVFEQILGALAGLETGSLAVLSGENSRTYLSKMPLYAQFAKNENGNGSVCRVILAMIEQRLDNEIIRRIEGITGPLQECSGVMVTIQNLSYAAGSLEP